jgi:acyl transferase domain-containing protein
LPHDVDRPWRAGVSGFAFQGTNAHVIVESYGPHPPRDATALSRVNQISSAPHRFVAVGWPEGIDASEDHHRKLCAGMASRPRRVLALSGKTSGALIELAGRWREWLEARRAEIGVDDQGQHDGKRTHVAASNEIETLLADAVFTAGSGRSHFNYRAAIPFSCAEDLDAGLEALTQADEATCASGDVLGVYTGVRSPSAGSARIGFLFTGQGSQWSGMGLGLYETEPVFRAVLDRCDAIVRDLRGSSLLDVMFGRAGAADGVMGEPWG